MNIAQKRLCFKMQRKDNKKIPLNKISIGILACMLSVVHLEARGYGKADIDAFCKESTSLPKKGIQFDGKRANSVIMHLKPGKYTYPNGGALLLFPNNHYVLKLPATNKGKGIHGTDGDDLLDAGYIVGGCSKEQLSEAVQKNYLDPKKFVLVRGYR